MTCAICLEDLLRDHAALPCGHVFHFACIEQLITRFGRCALCRVRTKRIIPLFIDGPLIGISHHSSSTLDNASIAPSTRGHISASPYEGEGVTAILESPNDDEVSSSDRADLNGLHENNQALTQRLLVAERKLIQMRQVLYRTKVELRDMQQQFNAAEIQNLHSRQMATVSYRQYNGIAKEKILLKQHILRFTERVLCSANDNQTPDFMEGIRKELQELQKIIRRPQALAQTLERSRVTGRVNSISVRQA
uniref:AlNc14C5G700 protein n=1 Tax=Albugo laibachii Nc14 TaxID=890382 RepID=F0W0R5_9STRA|nr:AlNc14C5G700 [Albugo laibachii Nc14]|eukprot:CCA14639.1 AlNc14C5G700 [Albugo laibachii Nc14]